MNLASASVSQKKAQTYTSIGVETGVAAANPHQLVMMLFDGALLAVVQAANAMQQGRIADKGQSVSKAIDIITNGLKASLDYSASDELSDRLASLYDYICSRLLHANMKNDAAALEEVSKLLVEIKSAWEGIANDPAVIAGAKNAG